MRGLFCMVVPGVEHKTNLLFLFDIYKFYEISISKFTLTSTTSFAFAECDANCAFGSYLPGRPSFSYCLASGQLPGSCDPWQREAWLAWMQMIRLSD
jgi:hypothetical protein